MLWKVLDPGYSQKAVGGGAMRQNLKRARRDAGLTQKQVAAYLGISETAYQRIEYGQRIGKIDHWDKLEDLFNIHQRLLRENLGRQDDQEKY